jgi:hypothetical protein
MGSPHHNVVPMPEGDSAPWGKLHIRSRTYELLPSNYCDSSNPNKQMGYMVYEILKIVKFEVHE